MTTAVGRSDRSTLAKGGVLNLVGMGFYGILNFGIIVIVTRRLGATGAGAFIEAIGLFSILSKTALVGCDTGMLRFVPKLRAVDHPELIGNVFRIALWPVVGLGAMFGVVVFATAGPLSGLLAGGGAGRQQLETYLRVMAPFIPAGAAYMVLENGARSLGTMVPSLVIERIARPLLQPVALLVVLSAGLGTTAVALSWAGPTVLAIVPMGLWVVALVRRAQRVDAALSTPTVADTELADRSVLLRRFWRFSGPRALGGLFQVLIIWLDTLLVGALASTHEAGIYGATTRWLIIGSFAGLAISQATAPQISYVLARRDPTRTKRLFELSTAWQMLVAFPPYLTVMVFAPVLLTAFGRGFGEGRDALLILGAANIFAAACGPVEVVLLMAGRSMLNLVDSGVSLAVNIILNLVLVPRYGITGAAVAWAASLFVTNAVPMVQVWRLTELHPFGRCWAHAMAIGLAAGLAELAVLWALGETLTAVVAGAALGGLTLVVLVVRFRRQLDLDDLVAAVRSRHGQGQGQTALAPGGAGE